MPRPDDFNPDDEHDRDLLDWLDQEADDRAYDREVDRRVDRYLDDGIRSPAPKRWSK